jgi:hypothetical protein
MVRHGLKMEASMTISRRSLGGSALVCVAAFASFVAPTFSQGFTIPAGHAPAPPGANLRVRMPTLDGSGFLATITNDGTRPLVSVTFVAIVEDIGSKSRPVRLVTSPEWMVSLGPQQSTTLTNDWLNSAQQESFRTVPSPVPAERLQMFVTPSRIRYADGPEWTLEIDKTETRSLRAIRKAFNFPEDVP